MADLPGAIRQAWMEALEANQATVPTDGSVAVLLRDLWRSVETYVERAAPCPRCGPTGDPLTHCTVCGEEYYTKAQSQAHTASIEAGRLPRNHLSLIELRPGPGRCGFYAGSYRWCRLDRGHSGEHQPT
jgi:hypothetical protein